MAAINTMSEDQIAMLLYNLGVDYVESAISQNPRVRESMDAIYSAILFESWIAFEAMASDLWVTAVDKGPPYIANTVAVSKDLKKVDDSITPKTLRQLEYDARREFGLFLRETRRVSFQKFTDIRSTYKLAFGEDAEKLFSETNQRYIEALSAFRNVFAHRAGKADNDFVNQVRRFPEFRHFKKDDQIDLDAATVRLLSHASAHMGLALIQFVDNFIDQHQPNS